MKKFLLSIFAVMLAVFSVQAQVWTKVTDASTLKAGDQLVIACSGKGVVASSLTSTYMDKAAATFSSDKSTITTLPSNATVLTLGGSKDAWILASASGQQLGATAVKKVAWVGGTKTWSISIENGNATIQSTTSSYGRFLYNSSSPRFTVYTSNATASMILPELYRLESSSGDVTPEVQAPAAPTLPASCNFDGLMIVEITNIAEGATAYYSLNNETDWVEGTSVEITETTTVYAKAVKDELSSGVVSATYTKYESASSAYLYTLTNSEIIGCYNLDKANANTYAERTLESTSGTWTGVFNTSKSGEYYTLGLRATNGNECLQSPDFGKTIASVKVVVTNSSSSKDRELILTGGDHEYEMLIPAGTTREFFEFSNFDSDFSRFVFTASDPLQITSIEIACVHTLKVGETEWATLCLDAAVVIPDGVDVWTVSNIEDGYVKLGEVLGVIPANFPVLVNASMAGDWEFVYTSETGEEYVNLLKGTTEDTYIAGDAYVLGNKDGIGLYKAVLNKNEAGEAGTTHFKNNANKAYLPASALTPAQQTAAFYGFDWNGTTGVEKVESRNEKSEIYDLTGRRVENPSNGIYIINGVKVLVK
ncbi:MAG: hypothetical protein IKJ49_08090 [Bacteroidaceae bacterium]|nr:hypothetical protein [Bacteroidaceae bacterium]